LPELVVLRFAVERARGFAVELARVAVPPRLEPLLDPLRDVRLLVPDDLEFDDLAVDDPEFDDRVDPDDLVDDDRFFDEPRFVLVLVWAIDLSSLRFRSGSGYPRFIRVIEMHDSLRTAPRGGTRKRPP
jgi:hypothetical protein